MTEFRVDRVHAGVLSGAKPLIVGAVGVLLSLSACGGRDDAPAADPGSSGVEAVAVLPTVESAPTFPSTDPSTMSPTTTAPPTTVADATTTASGPAPASTSPTTTLAVVTPTLPVVSTTTAVPAAGDTVSTTPPAPESVAVLPAAFGAPVDPARVLVAGDSTGVELSIGMGAYADAHPDEIAAFHSAFAGCGLSVGTDGRLHAWNTPTEWIDLNGCTLQWQAIPELVAEHDIDVVVVCIGPWDGTDIMFPDGSVVSVLDPVGRALVHDAYAQFVASVRMTGATPLFIRPATIDAEWERRTDPLDDPRRWEVMREIVDSLGVAQVDLPRFLTANGLDGPEGRPDGVHLADDVEARFIAEVVVPEVMRLSYL